MRVQNQQLPSMSVGFEIDPRHYAVADPKRQHVVTPAALLLWHINLDAIVKVEQALGPVSVPDHGIERRQQGCGRNRSRQSGIRAE